MRSTRVAPHPQQNSANHQSRHLRRRASAETLPDAAALAQLKVGQKSTGWECTGLNRLVIHPSNKFKAYFDLFLIICVTWSSVAAPLEVAYSVEISAELDIFLDVVFLLDIAVNMLCGYYDLGGTRFPVLDLSKVMRNYSRSWLILDLMAGIPFDRFLPQLGPMALIKTIRLLKVRRIMNNWGNLSYGPLLKVVVIIFFWALLTHWLACGFFALGWSTCKEFDTIGMGNWITHYWRRTSEMAPDLDGGTILAQLCIDGASPLEAVSKANGISIFTMHVRALAWALATMSSMGYGDSPVAISDYDYLYSFAAQMIGACLAAAIFSNIAQMINKGDASSNRYQEQLDKINEFIRLYKLPPNTRRQLLDYHELLFSAYRGMDLGAIASMFPKHVQTSIFYRMHKDMVRSVPLFQDCEVNFLSQLMLQIKPQVLLQNDFAFRQGDLGSVMYFIQFGLIEIGNRDMSVIYVEKYPGSFFGELAVVSSTTRTASAYGKTDCILYTLTKDEFEETAAQFPTDYCNIYEKANLQMNKIKADNNKMVCEKKISDASTPAKSPTSSLRIIGSMHPKSDSTPARSPSTLRRLTRGSYSEHRDGAKPEQMGASFRQMMSDRTNASFLRKLASEAAKCGESFSKRQPRQTPSQPGVEASAQAGSQPPPQQSPQPSAPPSPPEPESSNEDVSSSRNPACTMKDATGPSPFVTEASSVLAAVACADAHAAVTVEVASHELHGSPEGAPCAADYTSGRAMPPSVLAAVVCADNTATAYAAGITSTPALPFGVAPAAAAQESIPPPTSSTTPLRDAAGAPIVAAPAGMIGQLPNHALGFSPLRLRNRIGGESGAESDAESGAERGVKNGGEGGRSPSPPPAGGSGRRRRSFADNTAPEVQQPQAPKNTSTDTTLPFRFRVFHNEAIASVPPASLSSLYASQSAAATIDHVLPLLREIQSSVDRLGDRLTTLEATTQSSRELRPTPSTSSPPIV